MHRSCLSSSLPRLLRELYARKLANMIKPILSYLLFAVDIVRGRYHSSNGRESRLLAHVLKVAPKDDPKAVLDAIDHYAHSQEFYMNVGDGKGKILIDELHKLHSAKAILELGTYCGYSTILLASELKDPTARVYTIDICEDNVDIAKQMIAHAGQSNKVVHVVKPLEQAVQELRSALQSQGLSAFDLVFIDHEKSVYLSDLQLLMREGLISKGSVVVADNLKIPGAPEYVSWMKKTGEFTYKEHSICMGASALWLHDIIGVSVYQPTGDVPPAGSSSNLAVQGF